MFKAFVHKRGSPKGLVTVKVTQTLMPDVYESLGENEQVFCLTYEEYNRLIAAVILGKEETPQSRS